MNLYIRYFDEEALVYSVEEALAFLASLGDVEVNDSIAIELEKFMASNAMYPKHIKCPGSRGLTSSASSSSSWGSGLRISDDSHRRLETGTLRGEHERWGQEGRGASVTWFLKGSTEKG